MFFVMQDTAVGKKVYQRRVGKPELLLSKAMQKAKRCKGYILDESSHLVAQAFNPEYPRHVDSIVNISSGEDVLV